MNPYVGDNEFSDCFPENFKTEILPENAEPLDLRVYRVCLSGKIDQDSFRSTYEDVYVLHRPGELDVNDPSSYSTSCFEKRQDIKRSLRLFQKHGHPKAIVAVGMTGTEDGLVLQEKNKPNHGKKSHVDWWIYRNHDVSGKFIDGTSEVMGGKKNVDDTQAIF